MATTELRLEGDAWSIDGATVTITTATRQSIYRLPKSARRIVLETLSRDRARLILGGFTTTTVTVVGPKSCIEQLREAVL